MLLLQLLTLKEITLQSTFPRSRTAPDQGQHQTDDQSGSRPVSFKSAASPELPCLKFGLNFVSRKIIVRETRQRLISVVTYYVFSKYTKRHK